MSNSYNIAELLVKLNLARFGNNFHIRVKFLMEGKSKQEFVILNNFINTAHWPG